MIASLKSPGLFSVFWSSGSLKSTIQQVFFLLTIARCGRLADDEVIRLCLKIPENFVRLIF